jgi:SAM-dependent methyltransferase
MPQFVVEFGKDGTPPAEEGRLDAPAFHRNAEPLWQALSARLPAHGAVLEIGSGTGQHAALYAPRAPGLTWYPSDIYDTHLASIAAWRDTAGAVNLQPPQRIDVMDADWSWTPGGPLAAIVCVNVLHISPWRVSENLFAGAGRFLKPGGTLFVYGPFMRNGAHTAPSNASFDATLRAQNSEWGVRDIRDLDRLAIANGLGPADVLEMPSNNFVLAFARTN